MRRTFQQIVGATFLLTRALPGAAQDREITGAQIGLETKSVPVEVVTLENRRNSPLVAWQIALTINGKGSLIHTSDFSWQSVPASPTSGPIPPRSQRVIEIDIRDRPDGVAPTPRFALFEDGYLEGTPEAIEQWQRQRRERADDAQYWVRVFAGLPAGADIDQRRYLEIQAAERAAQAGHDPSGLRSRLSNLLRVWRQPGLFEAIEPISKEAARQYNAFTRPPANAPALEASAPVVVSSRRDARSEYVVVIRNLRDLAIEAVAFDLLDPVTGKPQGGQGADYGGTDIGTRTGNTGRIGGGDSREFPVLGKGVDGSPPQVPRLALVMFEDLTYEGSVERRAAVLEARERQADDIGYALSVRAEAASKPREEAVTFLTRKRAERAKALQARGRQISLFYIDELVKQAKGGPDHLQADSPYIQHLESRRAQLLRHLKR